MQALYDFVKVSGPVGMVPRGILGLWWSKWNDYTAKELIDLADAFRRHKVFPHHIEIRKCCHVECVAAATVCTIN